MPCRSPLSHTNAAAAIIVAIVALAGCGGAERASGPGAASDVAREAVLGSDAEAHCTALHTERFVRDTYGSIEECERVVRERNGPLLKDVRIDDARESSDTATARLTLPDGGSGELQLLQVDDGWRVTGYDVGLLHALGLYMTFEQVRKTASRPGLNADGARACVAQRLDDMPDDSLRSYVYTAIGARREGIDDVVTLIVRCLADPRSGRGGQSYLRPYFVQDAVAVARREGYTGAVLRCFERKLEAFTDEEIAAHVARDKADPPPATRRVAEALFACDA